MDFVSQEYWDQSYQNFHYHVANDDLTKWIERHLDLFTSKGRLFEFGCYPGRYLSFMGSKGWEVSGFDLAPEIETRFLSWLQKEGIKTRLIKRGDVVEYAATTEDEYDTVCSFGFIEHFENFMEIIELHHRILKPGGMLMITTPNFKGPVQKILHKSVNKEGLGIHYLPSMQPALWKKKLELKGYRVFYSGYFGGFDFWYDQAKRNFFQKVIIKGVGFVKPLLSKLPDSYLYSPYCGLIAKKPV